MASSIADSSAESSLTTARPRAATTSSGVPSPSSTPSMTWRASRSFSVPGGHQLGHPRHVGRRDRQVGYLDARVVRAPGQLAEPPLAGVGRRGAGRDGRLHGVERARVPQRLELQLRQRPRLDQPRPARRRQLGQRRRDRLDPVRAPARPAPGRARGSSGSPAPLPSTGPDVVTPVSSWKCRVSWITRPPESSTSACRATSERTARSTERSEFTFLVSVRVPQHVRPARARSTCSRRSAASPPPSARRRRRACGARRAAR